MGPGDNERAAWGTAGLTAAAMLAFVANSLPCRAALGGGRAGAGVLLLGESLSPRLVAGTLALGGIALAVAGRRR
jgi:hypothetical protein